MIYVPCRVRVYSALVIVVVVTICLQSVSKNSVTALIPYICVGNLSSTCCPIPDGSSRACGYPYRGICQDIYTTEPIPQPPEIFRHDVRYRWPLGLFNRGCRCYGNFFGYDCGLCWYGWTGERCHKRVVRLRRNILTYSPDEKRLLQRVLLQTRLVQSDYAIVAEVPDRPITSDRIVRANLHEVLVFIHYFASRPRLSLDSQVCARIAPLKLVTDCNHSGPGFLTWHRYFMLLWERQARAIARSLFQATDFTFPYWDWTDQKSCQICSDDLVGSETGPATPQGHLLSPASPFHNWVSYCALDREQPNLFCSPCVGSRYGNRNNGREVPITRHWTSYNFPASGDIRQALNKPYFYRYNLTRNSTTGALNYGPDDCSGFASLLEGPCPLGNQLVGVQNIHNRVHDIVDGSFLISRTSPNDPLFILHHVQIDRLFELWRRNHGNPKAGLELPGKSLRPGHCRDCAMVGFYPPVTHATVFEDSRRLGVDYDDFRFGD